MSHGRRAGLATAAALLLLPVRLAHAVQSEDGDDQALLAEGGQLEDPAAFVRRVNALMLEMVSK